VIVTLLNQKGGVGKTSTCHHLGGTLAELGRRILLVDNDPQSSLSQGFWGPVAVRRLEPSETIAALYRGDEPFPEQVIRPSGIAGVDLLPGSRYATSFNVPDPHALPYEAGDCLRSFLEGIQERYDLVMIDCAPNLHLCSWAALAASARIIVPLQAEDYGAQGIIDVHDSIARVRAAVNPSLRLLGYLITMFSARKTVHKMYEANLRQLYGPTVFATTIPHAADFPEAISLRKTIAQHKPRSAAAKAVRDLAEEVLARLVDADGVGEAA
jgi:chromosome partitioning protein